ncbi:hypothetical protein M514_05468 [Trichuris suis]|uniref:HTH OST-type domain-containing protein n=1 Tax=Trichuris suis TaxID=68888 RepID=A0A085NJM9_9BILA|nr:hypothetical protein M514_05468 [Trichuris suis]
MEQQIKVLSAKVHSVLLTFKNGAKASEFLTAYKDCAGGPFPISENGFRDLPSLMRALPDVVEIRKNQLGEELYVAKVLESTRLLQQLVAGQRAKDNFKRTEFKTRQFPASLQAKQPIPDPKLFPPKQPANQQTTVAAPKKKAKKKKNKKKPSGNLKLPEKATKTIAPVAARAIDARTVLCDTVPANAEQNKLPVTLRAVRKTHWSWPTQVCSEENQFLQFPRALTVSIVNIEGPRAFAFIIKDNDIVEAVEQLTPLMERNMKSTLGARSHFSAGASVLVPLTALESLSPEFSKVPQRGFLASLADVPPYCWDGFTDDFKAWLASEIAGKRLIVVPASKDRSITLGVKYVPVHLYVGSVDPSNELNKKIARICRKIISRCGNMGKVLSEVAHLHIGTFA